LKTITGKKQALQSKRATVARKASVKISANANTAVEAGGAPATKAASPAPVKAVAPSVEGAASREERLMSPVVSKENIGGGTNVVQKLVLENGQVALFKPAMREPTRRMRENITSAKATDIEKARQLFRDAGLAFPTIPAELAAQLKERRRWLFSTRSMDASPYNLGHYVEEAERTQIGDYSVLSHSGHGVNSYAIQYYLVHGSLRMFLFLAWGGVYGDAKADAAQIRDCFSIADQIVTAAQEVLRFKAGERLTVVVSDFYGSYWLRPGENRQGKDAIRENRSKKPSEALTEALGWLTSYRGGNPNRESVDDTTGQYSLFVRRRPAKSKES
jgi:hypothetical protein